MFKILLIGDACEDVYHYGHCERLSPEAPVPILKHNYTERRDGMCLNVSNNLKAFEISVKVLSNKRILKKQRFVDLKTKQHLLRIDFGESVLLKPCTKEELERVEFDNLDAVIISDYNKGFITAENTKIILAKAREQNLIVFVDSKKEDLSCFENCIIKINETEFKKIKKLPIKYELITTLASAGARWNEKVYPTEECEIFDVSGAGDTFLSALTFKYLETKSMEKAIKFANRCARIIVQKFGTYALTKKDIDDIRI